MIHEVRRAFSKARTFAREVRGEFAEAWREDEDGFRDSVVSVAFLISIAVSAFLVARYIPLPASDIPAYSQISHVDVNFHMRIFMFPLLCVVLFKIGYSLRVIDLILGFFTRSDEKR